MIVAPDISVSLPAESGCWRLSGTGWRTGPAILSCKEVRSYHSRHVFSRFCVLTLCHCRETRLLKPAAEKNASSGKSGPGRTPVDRSFISLTMSSGKPKAEVNKEFVDRLLRLMKIVLPGK